MENTEELTLTDISVGIKIRPRYRSVESPDQSCVVSNSRVYVSASYGGIVVIFDDRGVKRLRIMSRRSQTIL